MSNDYESVVNHAHSKRESGSYDASYNTKLTSEEEKGYQKWKAKYAPHDSGYDYDLKGAYKEGFKPDPITHHWSDKYKKPNHPTFSNESKYAKNAPEKAGHWEGEKYIPPKRKR